MEKETIRLLRAEEIECRVAAINGKGLSLLLFKDARVDQRILDETFTPFGWRRSHQEINGSLYCTVGSMGPGKRAVDCQAGRGDRGLRGKGEGAGLRFL